MSNETLTDPNDIALNVAFTDLEPGNSAGDVPTWTGTTWIPDSLTDYPVRVLYSGSNAFSVAQDANSSKLIAADTKSNVITINGDLKVNGNSSFITTNNTTNTNPLIQLGTGNAADNSDLGFYGVYVNSGTYYTGFFRDATDKRYKLANFDVLPNLTVGAFTLTDMDVNDIKATTVTGTLQTASQPNITTLSGLTTINAGLSGVLKAATGVLAGSATTTDLPEGSPIVNQYFTTARARSALSGSGGVSYNSTTGVISLNSTFDATLNSLVLSILTPNRLVFSSGLNSLTSVNLSSLVTGTTNQIVVTNDGNGGIVINAAQSIGTSSAPSFAGLTISGLTTNSLIASDGSKALQSASVGASLSFSANTLNTIQAITTTSSPTFATITASNLTASTLISATAGKALQSAVIGNNLTFTSNTLDTIQAISPASSPSFTGLTVSGVTASTLISVDSSKALQSTTIGASLSFSVNTLNTIQAITTSSSPTFAGATYSGLTASALVSTNGSKALTSVTTGSNLTFSANTLDTIQAITTASSPTFVGLTLSGLSAGRIPYISTGGALANTANLTWDNTNSTMTLGTQGLSNSNPSLIVFGKASKLLAGDGGILQYIATNDLSPIRLETGVVGSATATNQGIYIDVREQGVSENRPLVLNRYGGNVGIGIAAPTALLDIAGTLKTNSTVTLTGITASRMISTDSSQNLIATTLTGTANQITVSGLGTTTVTLSAAQDIGTSSSPTFAGATYNGLTASALVSTNSSKALSTASIGNNLTFSSNTLNTIQGIKSTDRPSFASLFLNGDSIANDTFIEFSNATSGRTNYLIYRKSRTGGLNAFETIAQEIRYGLNSSNLPYTAMQNYTYNNTSTAGSETSTTVWESISNGVSGQVFGFVGTDVFISPVTANSIVYANGSKYMKAATIGSSLSFSAPTLNTIQDIRTTASPQFANLYLTSSTISDSNLVLQANAASTAESYLAINKGGTYGALFGYTNGASLGTGLIIRNVASDASNIMFYVNSTTKAAQFDTSGNLNMINHAVYLKTSDTTHGIQYSGTTDGPNIFGFAGISNTINGTEVMRVNATSCNLPLQTASTYAYLDSNKNLVSRSAANFTSDVRSQFSASTGVSITSGAISIGQAVGTASSPQFTGLNISGATASNYAYFNSSKNLVSSTTFTSDVRSQFSAGSGITIDSGVISTSTVNFPGYTAQLSNTTGYNSPLWNKGIYSVSGNVVTYSGSFQGLTTGATTLSGDISIPSDIIFSTQFDCIGTLVASDLGNANNVASCIVYANTNKISYSVKFPFATSGGPVIFSFTVQYAE